jgi:ribulose-5-phosphate 4-epimerase/fuculose-1-phosphate aldolase
MSEAEWQTRLNLAACYRLVDLFGWSDLINTRITARVPGQDDHFLINPYGLLFDEITASSLVKIDADGNKVEHSEVEINSGGFAMPSTVHKARPEVACVLHTHSIAGCAVSMQRDGLLPLNQHALQIIADVAYHDYEGTGRNPDERARLFRVFIAVLRWNGQVVCRAAGSWRRTNGNGHHASLPRDAAGVFSPRCAHLSFVSRKSRPSTSATNRASSIGTVAAGHDEGHPLEHRQRRRAEKATDGMAM